MAISACISGEARSTQAGASTRRIRHALWNLFIARTSWKPTSAPERSDPNGSTGRFEITGLIMKRLTGILLTIIIIASALGGCAKETSALNSADPAVSLSGTPHPHDTARYDGGFHYGGQRCGRGHRGRLDVLPRRRGCGHDGIRRRPAAAPENKGRRQR